MGKIRDIVIGSSKSVNDDNDDTDIDTLAKQMEKEQARKVKESKLRTYLLQSELENKELEKKLKEYDVDNSRKRRLPIRESESPESPLPESDDRITVGDIEVAKELEKYPDEQRNKLLATLALMKSNPTSGDSNAMLLPIMLGMMGNAGSDPVKQTAELISAIGAIQQANDKGLKIDLAGLLKEFREAMTTREEKTSPVVDKVIDMAVKNLFSQPDPKNYILGMKEDFETFKKIFGGSNDLEYLKLEQAMKESDRKWELALKNLEIQRDIAKEEMRAKTMDRQKILDIVDQIEDAAKSALMEEGATEAEGVEASKGPVGNTDIVKTKCQQCGADLYYSPKYTKMVVCPNCGAEYEVKQSNIKDVEGKEVVEEEKPVDLSKGQVK